MHKHQNPKPNLISERFKFNSYSRQPKESISEYMAELHRLNEFCDYVEALEDMLCNWLVCGVNYEWTQQQLLSEGPSLTLQKDLDILLVVESAINQVLIIEGHQQSSAIDNTSANNIFRVSGKGSDPSFCCEGNHLTSACSFIDKECFYCKSKGHVMKVSKKLKADKKQKTKSH